jgi:hypothetical protein
MAELIALGTVTTMRMEQWAIRSQVLSPVVTRGGYGCSSSTKWWWVDRVATLCLLKI